MPVIDLRDHAYVPFAGSASAPRSAFSQQSLSRSFGSSRHTDGVNGRDQETRARPPAWLLVGGWALTGVIGAALAGRSILASTLILAAGGLLSVWTWRAIVPVSADQQWIEDNPLRGLLGLSPALIAVIFVVFAVW
jgi:hypothetical protein